MSPRLNINKFDGEPVMEVELYITRRFRFRIWLGLKLIKLGARITGMGVKVNPIQDNA